MDVDSPLYGAPEVEIVLPVRNEERELGPNVTRLVAHLQDRFPFTARLTIADNGSTDATWALARGLADAYPGRVRAVRLDLPGRGRALRAVWSVSDADVVAYMDVDLSTDLAALLPMVAPLLTGDADVAIGSRLAPGARVKRGLKRTVLSHGYNLLLRAALVVGFSDAQCGFKAVRTDAARALLPFVQDNGWFFDTELLVLAERAGLRIHEVPVEWTDSPDSRVRIMPTVLGDLRGVLRLWRGLGLGSLKVPAAPGDAAWIAGCAAAAGGVAEVFEVFDAGSDQVLPELNGRLFWRCYRQERRAVMTNADTTDMIPVTIVGVATAADEGPDRRERFFIMLASADEGDSRRLFIGVGDAEAAALALGLQGHEFPRPMTYQFMASLVAAAGSAVRSVRVTRRANDIFYAQVTLRGGAVVDARPSDAINLAAVTGVPVLVASELLDLPADPLLGVIGRA